MSKFLLKDLNKLKFDLSKPRIIFLKGDLGAGKTTISKHILSNLLGIKKTINSPTYTYYNKYGNNYHFDLYRLKNYDEFFAIGAEDILDNNNGIILIEWPDIIEKYYEADIIINIKKTNSENERKINITKKEN